MPLTVQVHCKALLCLQSYFNLSHSLHIHPIKLDLAKLTASDCFSSCIITKMNCFMNHKIFQMTAISAI